MTHRLITEHPAVSEIDGRIADLEAVQQVFRDRQAQARREHQEEVDSHRRGVREAVLAGEPIPPDPPPLPDRSDEARLLVEEINTLKQERRELLARLAVELEPAAAELESILLAAAGPHFEALVPIAEELADVIAGMKHLRLLAERAAGISPGSGDSDRMRSRFDVVDLVGVLLRGERPLEPRRPAPAGALRKDGEL